MQTRVRIEEKSGSTPVVLSNGQVNVAGVVIDATAKVCPASSYFKQEALDDDGHVRMTPE